MFCLIITLRFFIDCSLLSSPWYSLSSPGCPLDRKKNDFSEKTCIFVFRSRGAPGLLREYQGLLRSEKSMKKRRIMMKTNTCSRKAKQTPYFGDQKCHVWNLQNRCRIQQKQKKWKNKNKQTKTRFIYFGQSVRVCVCVFRAMRLNKFDCLICWNRHRFSRFQAWHFWFPKYWICIPFLLQFVFR